MKYIITILSIALLMACNGQDSTSINPIKEKNFEYSKLIDSLAHKLLEDTLINSLSIGVILKDQEFKSHYGELDSKKSNPPNDNTIYDIGSVSKSFVGTLMAKAEIEGKLSIEDDIRQYLEGDYSNLEYQGEAIKIKHLITHTSRLPRYLPIRILNEFNQIDNTLPNRMSEIELAYSKQEFFNDLKEVEIDTFPGYNYSYSNTGGELASYILEKVYGKAFEDVLKSELFSIANMNSTSIRIEGQSKNNYANGYGDYKNQTPPMNTNLWGGSGYGKSTLPDLLNYINFHLDEKIQFAQQSHRVLYKGDVIDSDDRNKMGYMWMIGEDKDFGKVVKHHGGAYGVQNWLLLYPEQNLGISIITNQSGWHTSGKLLNIAYGLLDEIAKDKKQ